MSTDLSFGDLENSQLIQGTRLEDQIGIVNDSTVSLLDELEHPGSVTGNGGMRDEKASSAMDMEPTDHFESDKGHPKPEIVTIDEDSKEVDLPENKKRPSTKTISLPKDFGCQIACVSTTQKEIAAGVDSIRSSLDCMDNKNDTFSSDLRALMEVHKTGLDQISKRIDRLAQNLRNVETELVKSNSVRHDTNLDILGIKIDGLSSSLNDVEGAVNICKISCEQTKESLFPFRTLEARLACIEAKMDKDKKKQQLSQVMTAGASCIENSPAVAGPSKKRPKSTEDFKTTGKSTKRLRASANEAKLPFPIGMHEYDQEKRFTYACRYAMIKGTKQGPKFERKCLFSTGHLSLMVSHRNYHANHGSFLLDGITKELDHRMDGKYFVCIKTTMSGEECGWKNAALSQFNRHSRKFLHKEDIFLLNNTCIPCSSTFGSDAELLNHINSNPQCYNAKGQFGIDSKDYSATGLTCGICGKTDFVDGNAVYEHQSAGSCKRGSEKVDDVSGN